MVYLRYVTVDGLLWSLAQTRNPQGQTAVHVSLSSDLIVKQRRSTPTWGDSKASGYPVGQPFQSQEGRKRVNRAAGVKRVLRPARS